MRIVFIGTVEFSRHCLLQVLAQGGDVVAVFSATRAKSLFSSDFADLEPVTSERGIPLHRVDRINDPECVALIRSSRPDVIFVFGFSQIIGPEILQIPPLGCIGTHPALLPRNRGRHPLIWALIEDLPESGLTFFLLDEGADSGDIVWQRPFPITDADDAGTLYRRIMELASEGISEILPMLERGELSKVPQDHRVATYWRKRSDADGEIHWTETARRIWNLVRALTRPYPGAHTFAQEARLTIWKASVMEEPPSDQAVGMSCGEVVSTVGRDAVVRAGGGFIRIQEWEGPGGFSLEPGMILGRKAQ